MRKPLRRRAPAARLDCPFCRKRLPGAGPLEGVFSSFEAVGGRCECGAVFVIDELGRAGGQALLDAQALLCDGDLDQALALDARRDFELRKVPLRKAGDNPFARPGRGPTIEPQAWVLKRTP